LSPTAHRIDREYLILEAINKYNSSLNDKDQDVRGVPVPTVYALCMDKEVVGAGFYVMEFLEGRVFQNIFMKEVNDEDRRAWYVLFSHFIFHLCFSSSNISYEWNEKERMEGKDVIDNEGERETADGQLEIGNQDPNEPIFNPPLPTSSPIIVRPTSRRR